MTNLIDMEEKKRRRKKTSGEDRPERIPLGKACDWLVEQINRTEHAPFSLPFPGRFYTVKTMTEARKLIVEELPGEIVHFSSLEVLVDRIIVYCREPAIQGPFPDMLLTAKKAREAAEFWLATTPPIDEPPPSRWQGDAGLSFNRLPWPMQPDHTPSSAPTWAALLQRMSNFEAFSAWVGSLFEMDSNNHQYIWMFGNGNDGKSAIARFLHKVFGHTCVSLQAPSPFDRFWASRLPGARVLVFPDCNARTFVSGGFFKSITGGDHITVEEKYRGSFKYLLNAKPLFLSNEMPEISSEKADMRRIIFCELAERKTPDDRSFEKKLWDEGGAFLSNCLEYYRNNYSDGSPIRSDASDIESWVSTLEEDYEETLAENFVVSPYSGHWASAPFLSARIVHIRLAKFDRHQRIKFLTWLQKKYGVRKKVVRTGTTTERRYLGIVLAKPNTENWQP